MANTNGNANPPAKPALVERVDTSASVTALVPTTIDGAMQLARWLSSSTLLPAAFKGKEADIFTMVMAGLELGLPPLAALRGMYIVNGKPALESKTKAALCISKGAAVYFKRTEYTDKATTWETLRQGQTEPVRMRFTREDAQNAGLINKDGPWKSYPQRMQSHRALGWLCDDVYPDIVLGVATAEDFEPEQLQYRPVSEGVAISQSPASPVAPEVISSVPSTAKPANPPATEKPSEPPLSEDEIVELITAIGGCGTHDTLKRLNRERIQPLKSRWDDIQRARILKAYEDQWELIVNADKGAQ